MTKIYSSLNHKLIGINSDLEREEVHKGKTKYYDFMNVLSITKIRCVTEQ